jgi:hypothetical protein
VVAAAPPAAAAVASLEASALGAAGIAGAAGLAAVVGFSDFSHPMINRPPNTIVLIQIRDMRNSFQVSVRAPKARR